MDKYPPPVAGILSGIPGVPVKFIRWPATGPVLSHIEQRMRSRDYFRTMQAQLEAVREFMLAFQQQCPRTPTLPAQHMRDLRYVLTHEENVVLRDAKTLPAALGAICDKLYVVFGDAVAYGFTPQQVSVAFAAVHRANMGKLWTAAQVNETKPCCGATVTSLPNGLYIVRDRRWKILKPPGFKAPDMEAILA